MHHGDAKVPSPKGMLHALTDIIQTYLYCEILLENDVNLLRYIQISET